jgi:putative transposase
MFHVAWCPKYRRKVITADAGTRLKEIIRQVPEERGAQITKLETMPNHEHLLAECDPQYGIHRLVKQIKGRSTRLPRQELPSLKSRMPTPVDE